VVLPSIEPGVSVKPAGIATTEATYPLYEEFNVWQSFSSFHVSCFYVHETSMNSTLDEVKGSQNIGILLFAYKFQRRKSYFCLYPLITVLISI
jgi:hypothetical protein